MAESHAPIKPPGGGSPPGPPANIVRCPIHGLSYNRDKSLGCLRCPDPARDQARAHELTRLAHSWRWSDVRRDPVKRALAGLAFALLVGFIPAAYYTYGVSGGQVVRLRARQAELSQQPGTPPVLEEFDRLDAAVARVRHRGMIGSAVLWVLVSGLAGAGFYRFAIPVDTGGAHGV